MLLWVCLCNIDIPPLSTETLLDEAGFGGRGGGEQSQRQRDRDRQRRDRRIQKEREREGERRTDRHTDRHTDRQRQRVASKHRIGVSVRHNDVKSTGHNVMVIYIYLVNTNVKG